MTAPQWSTACLDWERRIVARQSLIPFQPLFPAEAAGALEVMDELRIVDMPGSPTFGDVSRDWIREFVASVFGAYDAETGVRLIKEWFLLISKKNTKSTTAGLLMLDFLILNWRQAGEFGILAPTVEVANNAFKPAADAVKADEELSALLHVQDHIRTITHRETKATLQVVAADSETVAGKKWIVTLVDELWLFGKRANAEDMLREATGGLASRDEGCVIWCSTQSNEPPAGVFQQKLEYARGVRDGRIVDPQFCPVLYEFPQSMIDAGAHRKPANFYVTNPNMGASVSEQFLVRELAKAEEAGEESVRGFLAKHLNVQIGIALKAGRWAGADFWEAAGSEPVTSLDELLERCDVITVGADGGGLDDLFGLAALGREEGTGDWLHWGHAWVHPIALERRKAEVPRYRDFEADGDLTICDRIGQDIEEIADLIASINEAGLLDRVGVDPVGIGALVDALHDKKLAEDQIVGISQGWKMVGAVKTTERKVAALELRHGASRMMAWCVGNARAELKGNALVITKQVSGSGKIDPLMALFNAVALMATNPKPRKKKYQLLFV